MAKSGHPQTPRKGRISLFNGLQGVWRVGNEQAYQEEEENRTTNQMDSRQQEKIEAPYQQPTWRQSTCPSSKIQSSSFNCKSPIVLNRNYKYRKREKIPYLDNIQQQKAKKLSRRLCDHLRDAQCEIVMDDEKYFTFAGHKMPGNAGYYTNDKQTCPNSVRFAGKPLYPRKVLVWIAISERGFSKVLIRPSKSEAIDSETYINECLSKRLPSFLHKHHGDFNYIF